VTACVALPAVAATAPAEVGAEGVFAGALTGIGLAFTEPIDPAGAAAPANYALVGAGPGGCGPSRPAEGRPDPRRGPAHGRRGALPPRLFPAALFGIVFRHTLESSLETV